MTFHRDPPGRLPTARQTLYSPDTSWLLSNNTILIQAPARGSHTTTGFQWARTHTGAHEVANAVATSQMMICNIPKQHKLQIRRNLLATQPMQRVLGRRSATTVVEVCARTHT